MCNLGRNGIHWNTVNIFKMDCSYKIWLDLQSKPLHPNISIYVLYTLLDTFPLVLTRRIWVIIKAFMVENHFLFFCDLDEWFSTITIKRNYILVYRVKALKVCCLYCRNGAIADLTLQHVTRSKCWRCEFSTYLRWQQKPFSSHRVQG